MSEYTSPQEFKDAYDTLHATFKSGLTKSIKWRKWQLKQIYWMIADNEEILAEALRQDLHRHPYESICFDIVGVKGDVLTTLKNFEKWAQGEAPEDAGFVMGRLGKAWLRKEPLGVALIIGAWNFPLYTLLSPFIAAVAAGNCVLLKPSELATTSQKALAQLVPRYLDQSAVRLCTGGAQETGRMLEHKFNHIFYTGGSKVGRIIAMAAAKHLTPVVLELGGQAPAIVTKNTNIDLAAKRMALAKLTNAGQICLNVNHVFADPAVHDELVERTIYWLKEFLKNGTDYLSHVISDGHFSRVTNLLKRTQGNIVYGGNNDGSTKFIHPSIITDIKMSDSLLSEELFCPYIPIIKADVHTAIRDITSMPHPLGLYIFSDNQKEIDYILDNTASGGVTINDIMAHGGVPSAPFGGVGESGYGAYHGKYGFEAFSHTRTVVTMPSYLEMVMKWRYPPYKIENRKYVEGALPKVTFERGEAMEDQKISGQAGGIVRKAAFVAGFLGAAVFVDYLGGYPVGVSARLGRAVGMIRS